MTALVSMAREETDCCAPISCDRYGYGLRLCLDEKQCEALGITAPLKAGSAVAVQARAVVVRATETAEADKAETHVMLELQITDMAIGTPNASRSDEEMAGAMYAKP